MTFVFKANVRNILYLFAPVCIRNTIIMKKVLMVDLFFLVYFYLHNSLL